MSYKQLFEKYDLMQIKDGYLKMILADVLQEKDRAEEQHPIWPINEVEQAGIVCEESGELIRAALNFRFGNGDMCDMRKEAIQTAATCIRFLIHYDIRALANIIPPSLPELS